jgi:hypothetical protein
MKNALEAWFFSKNSQFEHLAAAGRGFPQKQAVAIALNKAGKVRKMENGGMVKGFSPIVRVKQRFQGVL